MNSNDLFQRGNKMNKTGIFVDAKRPGIRTFVNKDTLKESSMLIPYYRNAHIITFSNLLEVSIYIHPPDAFNRTHSSLKAVVPQRLRETGVMR